MIYIVEKTNGSRLKVEAENVSTNDGMLTFYNGSGNSYNVVAVFAPNDWSSFYEEGKVSNLKFGE